MHYEYRIHNVHYEYLLECVLHEELNCYITKFTSKKETKAIRFFFQFQNELSVIINTPQAATVIFTNPFNVAVNGELTVSVSGLLEEKAQMRCVKCVVLVLKALF